MHPMTCKRETQLYKSNEITLTESIASEELTETLACLADVALDAAITEGILDGVPIIGTLTSAAAAISSMSQKIYVRKVAKFIKELATIPLEERNAFLRRIDSDDKRFKFGEAMLLILERTDDMEKPTIIGRITAAHIQGRFDLATSLRLCSIVNRCYLQDLAYLKVFKNGVQGSSTAIAASLFSAGVISNGGFDGGTFDADEGGVIYNLNEFGQLLIKYGL